MQIKEDEKALDNYIAASNKIRIRIAKDGHCLPRAIFRGAKLTNELREHINYKSFFREVIAEIKENMDEGFITESREDAVKALDLYLNKNDYAVPSNSIDMVLVWLARQSSCNIKVHYRDITGVFDTHFIASGNCYLVLLGLAHKPFYQSRFINVSVCLSVIIASTTHYASCIDIVPLYGRKTYVKYYGSYFGIGYSRSPFNVYDRGYFSG